MSDERALLRRWGLSDGAGPEEIEATYNDIVAYLDAAPRDLRRWAQQEIESADRAYALLSGATDAAEADDEPPQVNEPRKAKPRPGVSSPAETQALPNRFSRPGRLLIAAATLIGVLAVGYVVYASDMPSVPGLSGTPAPETAAGQLDTARVAELMQALQATPDDVATLQELADVYFFAADYTTAATWEEKILGIEPDNLTAHLALGAAQYNIGDSASAEVHWRRVLELDPQNVEAHYDLGFMYFSADPPDTAQAIAEWRQVVELAPDSDIAQTVSTHLATLEEWQASASPGPASPAAPASP